MRIIQTLSLVVAVLASTVATVHATAVSFEATDNATIQPSGPRTGANGKNFYNMEGSVSGGTSFSSFGVSDFNFATLTPTLGGTVTGINSVSLALTESNSAFSSAGTIGVYYTTNTAASIQPVVSTLKYQVGNDGLAAIDPALAPLTLLGTGTFTNVSNGTVDSVTLSFNGGALSDFLAALNSGTTLRLVTTAEAPTVAATFAGFSNNTYAGPTLNIDAAISVPEPSTFLLGGIAIVGLMAGRTFRRTATHAPKLCNQPL